MVIPRPAFRGRGNCAEAPGGRDEQAGASDRTGKTLQARSPEGIRGR